MTLRTLFVLGTMIIGASSFASPTTVHAFDSGEEMCTGWMFARSDGRAWGPPCVSQKDGRVYGMMSISSSADGGSQVAVEFRDDPAIGNERCDGEMACSVYVSPSPRSFGRGIFSFDLDYQPTTAAIYCVCQ